MSTDRKMPDDGTTGHEWDGIREWNNPLPRWWLWILYATIAFSIVYMVLYPALPGLTGASAGTLRYNSRRQLEAEMAAIEASRAETLKQLTATPLADLPKNSELMRFAVQKGKSAFKVNCVQCHGSGAAGLRGYPNLNDDDWLWGGDMASIHTTLLHGIRYPSDEETRQSAMPAFGRDELLTPAQIDQVVEHVRRISRQEHDAKRAAAGAAIFAEQCALCHGSDGRGNRELGAPNLTDAIWLYGGDREALHYTVTNARNGVMPGWGQRLDPATVTALAAYVHSLGGGE